MQTVVPEPLRYDPSGIENSNRFGAAPREGGDGSLESRIPRPERTEIDLLWFPRDIVCICVGKHAGRWGTVTRIEEKDNEETGNVFVLVRGQKGRDDELVCKFPLHAGRNTLTHLQLKYNKTQLVRWSLDMLAEGKLPDTSSSAIYEKTVRNRFVGSYVRVWKRGEKGLVVRQTKGMYGFVLDIDEEKKTARVSFQNSEAILPLKNLVSP